MANRQRGTCVFSKSLQKNYPFLRKQKNRTDSDIHCEICMANISISYAGISDIKRHLATKKHKRAMNASADLREQSNEGT